MGPPVEEIRIVGSIKNGAKAPGPGAKMDNLDNKLPEKPPKD